LMSCHHLVNVLCLESSLIGLRPIVQSEVACYTEDTSYYYKTRRGLTGLWQVGGRSETSYERRVQLDIQYVKNWTI
jgi:lipopolysaccharide/colanic/teichoic acid biosynthesis glycosyltransferase